jgi:hypothetical protein
MSTQTYYWFGGKAHIPRPPGDQVREGQVLCGRIFPSWPLWTARYIDYHRRRGDILVCKTCLRLAGKEEET